jgi:hypothetical protein
LQILPAQGEEQLGTGVAAANATVWVVADVRTGLEVVRHGVVQSEVSTQDLVVHIHDYGEISVEDRPMGVLPHYCCVSRAAHESRAVLTAVESLAHQRSGVRHQQ